jgi:hypothetical protein
MTAPQKTAPGRPVVLHFAKPAAAAAEQRRTAPYGSAPIGCPKTMMMMIACVAPIANEC